MMKESVRNFELNDLGCGVKEASSGWDDSVRDDNCEKNDGSAVAIYTQFLKVTNTRLWGNLGMYEVAMKSKGSRHEKGLEL